jgi:hypothetical protein
MEKNKKLTEITEELETIQDDTSIPRNIRVNIAQVKERLLKEDTDFDIKIATALCDLGDLSNDPNIPIHGRTLLWSIMSELEKYA